MKRAKALLFILSLGCMFGTCYGAAQETFGPDSVIGHPTTEQPGWAPGIVQLPRHPSRVYSYWVNGNENFYFKATQEQINEMITLFSKARMRDHELCIKTDKPEVTSFQKQKSIDYNVHLNVTAGIVLALYQSENNTETFEPVLTLYVDGDAAWVRDLHIPDNIILNSDIDGLLLESKAARSNRVCLYGQVQLEDMNYYDEYQKGYFTTQVTLWEKDAAEGINVGRVDYQGYLSIPFSSEELASVKRGDSWLTISIGNPLVKPERDHTRFSPEKLSIFKETAGTEMISMPEPYYGRILFEDGTPPVLEPKPWPGAGISVSFAYAGMPTIDKQGCFQVYFTDEQFETLKDEITGKNIYFPSYSEQGQSTAKYSFPVSILTRDKDNPGVVNIPRPELMETD